VVVGDPERLQQVIWNLLSNAIKFTPRSGRIEIQLQRHGSEIQISVSDIGKRIPKDFLSYVFDPFSEADKTSMRRHGGLGLGLAIVRQIVEKHGGSVEVRSEEGKGSTFTIHIPGRNLVNAEPTASNETSVIQPAEKETPPYTPRFDGRRML
jgi:signal transduction histidine kinase